MGGVGPDDCRCGIFHFGQCVVHGNRQVGYPHHGEVVEIVAEHDYAVGVDVTCKTLHGIGLAHFGREYLDDAHILAEDVDIVADRAVD